MATLSFINWVTRGQKVHNRLIKLSLVSVACAMPHTLLDVSLGVNNWFFLACLHMPIWFLSPWFFSSLFWVLCCQELTKFVVLVQIISKCKVIKCVYTHKFQEYVNSELLHMFLQSILYEEDCIFLASTFIYFWQL